MELARQTKFVQRTSKLKPVAFLTSLMFAHQQGKDASLMSISGDLYSQEGIEIKKQSIDERFNSKTVDFFKATLTKLLHSELNTSDKDDALSYFNRVRIKDSTRFALPSAFSETYTGHGGATHNSESMISIQYEYDFLTKETMDLRLTTGTRNDQLDAKENTDNIIENDLFLRDLGYATLPFMSQIIDNNACFLNRLNPQISAYHEQTGTKVDFDKCQKKIKKHNLPYIEYNVQIGKKAQIPCRLIIYPVDKSTYERRLRKTSKQAKSCGHQVSKEFKTRAKMTIYVTNVKQDILTSDKIKQIYGLRWQIELTFKVWKSQGKINAVKEMKIERFECQLMAKLIWLLFHMKIYHYLTGELHSQLPDKTISLWKYYRHAFSINYLVRKIISNKKELGILLLDLINLSKHVLLLETKKGKHSHYETFMLLT